MEPYHDIDDKNGNVTKRATTSSQIRERLVSGSINNEQTRNLVLLTAILVHDGSLGLDGLDGEVRCTNLLGDTSSFTLLDVRLTNL